MNSLSAQLHWPNLAPVRKNCPNCWVVPFHGNIEGGHKGKKRLIRNSIEKLQAQVANTTPFLINASRCLPGNFLMNQLLKGRGDLKSEWRLIKIGVKIYLCAQKSIRCRKQGLSQKKKPKRKSDYKTNRKVWMQMVLQNVLQNVYFKMISRKYEISKRYLYIYFWLRWFAIFAYQKQKRNKAKRCDNKHSSPKGSSR